MGPSIRGQEMAFDGVNPTKNHIAPPLLVFTDWGTMVKHARNIIMVWPRPRTK